MYFFPFIFFNTSFKLSKSKFILFIETSNFSIEIFGELLFKIFDEEYTISPGVKIIFPP